MTKRRATREIILTASAREDLAHWRKSSPKIVKRINIIFESILIDPEHGIGKPEKLKYELFGYWSRRINHKDRIVYEIRSDAIIVLQLRDHY